MKHPVVLVWLSPVLLLSACAANRHHETPEPAVEKVPDQDALDPRKVQQLHTDVIRGLLEKGQFYAALAHIEQEKRGGESIELTFLEAETRRHLGQRQPADALYRKLIGTPAEGQGWHGIGLLLAATPDIDGTIRAFRSAEALMPTDVEIRNDLGYALMQAGRYTEALTELSTAAELAPAQLKSRNNLIILMLLTGNQAGVTQLSQQAGTTPETMRQLRDQAQAIRGQQASRPGRVPT